VTLFLAWLRTSWLGRALTGLVAALALLWGTYLAGKREGHQNAKQKGREADAKRADEIRRRARDADGLHDDGSGYRD